MIKKAVTAQLEYHKHYLTKPTKMYEKKSSQRKN